MKREPALCGFCMTGNHARCAGTILNGTHGTWRCACRHTDRCAQNRCHRCNAYGSGVADDARCLDRDACEATYNANAEAARQKFGLLLAHADRIVLDSEGNVKKTRTNRRSNTMATATDTKGTAWLTEQVNEKTDRTVDGKTVRVLLRKLAADGTIEKGDGRWTFTGLKDPAVVAVIKAVKAGEADPKPRGRKPAAETAEKPARKPRARKAAEPEVSEELEDDEELDLEEL